MLSRKIAMTAGLLIIGSALLARAGEPTRKELASKSYLGAVGAGQAVIFKVDPQASAITLMEQTNNKLHDKAWLALARAPRWLENTLRESLRLMDLSQQQAFSEAILAADAKQVDEIAFVAAHLTPEDLKYATPALVVDNAKLIYELAPKLGYADIVEHGDASKGGDFYTSLKLHRLKDGKAYTYELPREIYYWWVVHPILSTEPLTTVDPAKGALAKPPTGVFWRRYLLASLSDAVSSRRHFVLTAPNTISDANLTAWKATASASLDPTLVGPNEVIRDSAGKPVLIQYNPEGYSCCKSTRPHPNPDGIFLATTIPLESLAAQGQTTLLENMLLAGPGRRRLHTWTLASLSPYTKASRKVLIVRDQIPFAAASDPNEAALKKYGYSYDVLTSAKLGALIDQGKLSSAKAPYINLEYNKIVVPSDQPLSLYKLLVSKATALEAFVKNGGVLQIHGNVTAANDWSALTLPGKIRSTAHMPGSLTSLQTYGNALLRDVITVPKILWDGKRRCTRHKTDACLRGDRRLDSCPDAIDRIGWWTSQMLDRCVLEHRMFEELGALQSERSAWPQRIVNMHYGNCGEQHALLGAASRAALVPALYLKTSVDHVWNEFYIGDGLWLPHEMGYSDAPLKVGRWALGNDHDNTPTRTTQLSVVYALYGDGRAYNLLGRWPLKTAVDGLLDNAYSKHLTLQFEVLDANKRPVDGAVVSIIIESPISKFNAIRSLFGVTDRYGKVSLAVGDGRDLFVNIATPLGHYPRAMDLKQTYVPMEQFKHLLAAKDAVAGATIKKQFVLTGQDTAGVAYKAASVPKATLVKATAPPVDTPYSQLEVDLEVPMEYRPALSPLARKTFFETAQPGQADLYVTDAAGYALFKEGKDFSARLVSEETGLAGNLKTPLPDGPGPWYVIVSNKRSLAFRELAKVKVGLASISPAVAVPDPEGDGEGCSCRLPGQPSSTPAWPGLLLLLALLRRRGKNAGL